MCWSGLEVCGWGLCVGCCWAGAAGRVLLGKGRCWAGYPLGRGQLLSCLGVGSWGGFEPLFGGGGRRQGTYGKETIYCIELGLPDWDPRCLKSQFFVEFTIKRPVNLTGKFRQHSDIFENLSNLSSIPINTR